MSEFTRHILRIFLVLSPAIFTLLLMPLSSDTSGLGPTVAFFVSLVLGAPLIATAGLVVSAIGRKKPNASAYSIWGYAGAAFLAVLYVGSVTL